MDENQLRLEALREAVKVHVANGDIDPDKVKATAQQFADFIQAS